MAVVITTTMEWPDLPRAAIGRAHRAAGMAVGGMFIRDDLPKRFDGSMVRELAWEPRAASVERRKRKRGNEGRHHYWSGKTRRHLLSGGARTLASARAKVYRVRIVLSGLNKGYERRPSSDRPNMRSEISRFSNEEATRLSQLYVAGLADALKDEMAKNRKRIKL